MLNPKTNTAKKKLLTGSTEIGERSVWNKRVGEEQRQVDSHAENDEKAEGERPSRTYILTGWVLRLKVNKMF